MLREEEIARDIARDVLDDYRTHKRLARQFPTVGSPVSDGMPTGSTIGNSQENKYVKYMDDPYKRFCEYCDDLIKTIENEDNNEWAKVLRYTFINDPKPTVVKISKLMSVSRPTYYSLLEKALVDFGESMNYQQITAYYAEMDNLAMEAKRKHDELDLRRFRKIKK